MHWILWLLGLCAPPYIKIKDPPEYDDMQAAPPPYPGDGIW